MNDKISFTLPIIPRTKKNSSRIVVSRKSGRPFILPSEAFEMYQRDCLPFVPRMDAPLNIPVNIKALFYMPTRRRVDLVNLEEALLDVLVHYGILEDDNSNVVAGMDGSRVMYSKTCPRTEVEIEGVEGDS